MDWLEVSDWHYGPSFRAARGGKAIKFYSKSSAQDYAEQLRERGVKGVRISKDTHGKEFWYVAVIEGTTGGPHGAQYYDKDVKTRLSSLE